jgi:hypothetical protein
MVCRRCDNKEDRYDQEQEDEEEDAASVVNCIHWHLTFETFVESPRHMRLTTHFILFILYFTFFLLYFILFYFGG